MIELSRTPVVVVSAGIKSILDIKKTLEVLETFGVPTGVWQSKEFPSFFSPVSGVRAPAVFDNAMDVARAYLAGQELGMGNGILVVSHQLRKRDSIIFEFTFGWLLITHSELGGS